ncbi:hypothetical protein [Kitasatospora sp. NPDC005748]|uniref:hypothetical protein n=1 Tax=Kitasatospora sp. NPDC005748 TaxID=3157063 RepID=UPI0033D1BA56
MSVHPGHVGEDRAGEIGSEGGQRRVAGCANRDAVSVELLGHAVRRDRLAGDHAGEEPSRSWVGSREVWLWLFGEASQGLGESRGQQHGVTAQDQVGVLVTDLEVFGGQVTEAFGGRAEQQGDRTGCPDVRGQGVVGY